MVTEGLGGASGASARSSYDVSDRGDFEGVSPSVGTTQSAACWVGITPNSRLVVTTNTGSGTISGYSLSPEECTLTLLAANGVNGTTGAAPIDMALSGNDRFLYALNSADGTISAFRVNADGSLATQIGAAGLPAAANGLAAR